MRFGFVTARRITIALGLLAGAAVMAAGPSVAKSVKTAAAESAPASMPTATDIRLGGDERSLRFVMDLTQKIDVAVFTLADPYRVVVDLPEVVFKLPGRTGEHGRGLVKAFRYGLIMRGGSRIVIDTNGPVKVEKAFVLDSIDGQPARMVLDLAATDRTTFLHNIALANREQRTAARRSEIPPKAVPNGDARPLIVLDPGHGGIDDGARAPSGEREKAVVLAFGLVLKEKIEQSGKYRVAMTRGDDTFIPLGERVRFARAHGASLFISIHSDFIPRREGQAEGATIYTLSERASDKEAAKLADAENKSDVIAGVDLSAEPNGVANILIDLAQRETKAYSVQFARTLVSDLKPATRLHLNPLKSAGFVVLKAPDIPSVLVELGYISTKDDLHNLMSPVWRARTADAVMRAIDTFFAPRLAGAGRESR
jgi:N-acetylmuramoyl-L-alanine amidase